MNFLYQNQSFLPNQSSWGSGQGWHSSQLQQCQQGQQWAVPPQYESQYFQQEYLWSDPQYELQQVQEIDPQQEVFRAEAQSDVRRPVAPIDFRTQDPIQISRAKAKRTRKRIVQTTVKMERDQLRKEVKDLEEEMRELKFKLVRSQAKVRTLTVSGAVHRRGGASMAEKDAQVRSLQRELEDMRRKVGKRSGLQQREVEVVERERRVKEEEDRLKAWKESLARESADLTRESQELMEASRRRREAEREVNSIHRRIAERTTDRCITTYTTSPCYPGVRFDVQRVPLPCHPAPPVRTTRSEDDLETLLEVPEIDLSGTWPVVHQA